MSRINIAHPLSNSQVNCCKSILSKEKLNSVIDLTDSIADITANIIHESEYFQLPSDIFEKAVIEAINDLIDDFALNPDSYLKSQHLKQIDTIAHEYLNS